MTADTRSIIQSIIDSDNTFSGQIVADIPNMNSILKRLERSNIGYRYIATNYYRIGVVE